jgi:GNAT superfamily N-acetyltransferase
MDKLNLQLKRCSDMMIRRATEDDALSVLQMTKRLFDDLHHQLTPSDGEHLSFCKSILKRGDYIVFISEAPEGNATGVLTMAESCSIYAGGKFGIIQEFYVIPEMRSHGVGKELLKRAIGYGKHTGWKRIEVTPPEKSKWPRTYSFYSRELFKKIGPRMKLENLD